MDYVVYCTIILALLAIIVLAMQFSGRRGLERQMKLAQRARKRHERVQQRASQHPKPDPHRHAVLQRQLKNVPTPWGWPGSGGRRVVVSDQSAAAALVNGSPGTFQRWIDHLIAEKRTVEDREYRQNGQAALRSMIEDRFGRTPQPQEMAYQSVRPPRLMDPQRPPDQMDNFPSGKTEQIVSGLSRQPEGTRAKNTAPAVRRKTPLEDIRTPWGW